MRIFTRTPTATELRGKYRDISWFELRRRRLAREEAQHGVVEEVSFSVARAWRQFTCDGAPCCPNAWFIETEDGMFVALDSWDALAPIDDRFPGKQVTAVRWPQTLRLISVSIAGDSLVAQPQSPEALIDLANHYVQCVIYKPEELPESVRAVLRAA